MVVVSYGITSRVAQRALELARERGIRAGKFRIDFGVAVPRAAHPRTGRARESLRGAGD